MKKKIKKTLIIIGSVVLSLLVLCIAFVLIITRDYSKNTPVSVEDCRNPHIAKNGKSMVSAHRSGGGIAPENTMLAFENCIENKDFSIDIFEFDLHITKDKELILLHDETLDRTSDSIDVFGRKDVKPSEVTYEELRQLNMGENFINDFGETPYKGLHGSEVPDSLRIVRLQDIFDYLIGYGNYNYIIEIKDKKELGKQACDKLYEIMKQYNLLDRVIVATFHGEITDYMDKTYPNILRSASVWEVVSFYFDSLFNRNRPANYYKFVALQIPDDDYVAKLGTTRFINYAHKYDIAVQYWTINDVEKVKELSSKGADAIMSDHPDMVYQVLYKK